ncbi:MAG: hypothetical protein U5M23_15845 [Marinagarivorans sp.]|nr:hypothetical protein [Marinagarivorans sp.]
MNKIILLVSILSVVLMQQANAGDEKRIKPSDVNIRNYEDFVSQVREDLPVGTSVQQVKNYLSNRDLEYGYADVEGCIKFMIKKVDSAFFVFKTDLQVKIFVTDEKWRFGS